MSNYNDIVIYSRSGPGVGHGHVVRCENLARALRERGAKVDIVDHAEERTPAFSETFIVDLMGTSGTKDLIIDLMENDDEFLRRLRPLARKLIVIVGVGRTITNATHWIADLVVYQAPFFDCSRGVPGENVVSGLDYIMLDPSYAEKEDVEKERDALVYVGGGIVQEFVDEILAELKRMNISYLLVGRGNGWLDCLKNEMDRSRIFIGSMGMAVYEALACDVPSIMICRSDDHMKSANKIAEFTTGINLGEVNSFRMPEFIRAVNGVMAALPECSLGVVNRQGKDIVEVDGFGIYRVAKAILDV